MLTMLTLFPVINRPRRVFILSSPAGVLVSPFSLPLGCAERVEGECGAEREQYARNSYLSPGPDMGAGCT